MSGGFKFEFRHFFVCLHTYAEIAEELQAQYFKNNLKKKIKKF